MIDKISSDGKEHWNEERDVIVIGSGFAGLSAAIEACNCGASVLILEKMKAPGGNSLISDGGIAAAGTDEQAKMGILDSPELMYRDMMRAGLGINHPDLVKVLAASSREAYEWSRDYLKVEYLDRIDIFGGHSVPRCFTAKNISGATIIRKMMEKIKKLDIEIRYKNHFTGFLRNKRGRITGVSVRENHNYRRKDTGPLKHIKAGKAVILAAGGFGSDTGFRSLQDPRLTGEIGTTNQPFSTAEALKEGLRIGASPVQLSHIQLGPWASPDETGYGDGPSFSEYIVFQKGIIINPATGKRIVNELSDRKTVSDAILYTENPCIGIADSKAVSDSGWNIDRCIKKGVVRIFDSLRELASFYIIKEEELTDSVRRFNTFINNRNDTEFRKPISPSASEIGKPPFYAIRLWPKVHHTMGGLGINTNSQVLDLDGSPIEGLYAAGEVTGGIHGASRLGSCAIAECIVFGRIAGKNGGNQNIEY